MTLDLITTKLQIATLFPVNIRGTQRPIEDMIAYRLTHAGRCHPAAKGLLAAQCGDSVGTLRPNAQAAILGISGISLPQHPYSPLAFRSLHSAMIRAAFSAWRQVKIPKKRSLIGTDSGSICKSHGQIGRRGTGVAPVDPSPGQDKDSASIAAL
jgi:hypothetical protein